MGTGMRGAVSANALPCLFLFLFGGSSLVPGIDLSVQHGVELLLQALPDFFFIIVFAPQMIHGEVDEQITGDLYACSQFVAAKKEKS